MRIRFNKNIYRLFGIGLFIYIASSLDFHGLGAALTEVGPELFVAALFFSAPNIFIKSIRWRYLAGRNMESPIKIGLAFRYYWAAVFWGGVTPGKIGELYKVKYLACHGMNAGSALAVTLIDRLADVLCILLFACAGMFYLSIGRVSERILILAVLVSVVVAVCLFVTRPKLLMSLFEGRIKSVLKTLGRDEAADPLNDFFCAFKSAGIKSLSLVMAMTVVTWFMFFLQRYLIALSLGMHVSFLYFSVIMVVMALVSLLPVSVNGIGTRDAVLIYFLGHLGFAKEQSVALSALILAVMLINVAVGYIFYLSLGRGKEQKI